MSAIYDTQAPKKPTNVSINGDLLARARELNINLSATLEQALTEQLRVERREQWKRENAKAIDAYNRYVNEHGVFSDGVRQF